MRRSSDLPRFCISLAAMFVMCAPAMPQGLRIHDVGRAASSKDAKDAFQELASGDQDVFGIMIENVRALQKKTLEELYALNQDNVRTTVNAIPALNWAEISEEVSDLQSDFVDAYRESVQTSVGKDGKLITPAVAVAIIDATAALEDANKKLAAAQSAFNAKQTELKALTEGTAEPPRIETLQKSVAEIRAAISFHPGKIKNIADLSQFKVYQTAWAGVSGAKSWIDQIVNASHAPDYS